MRARYPLGLCPPYLCGLLKKTINGQQRNKSLSFQANSHYLVKYLEEWSNLLHYSISTIYLSLLLFDQASSLAFAASSG